MQIIQRFLNLTYIVILVVLVSSCSKEPETTKMEMPIVNDENCKHEEILKIKDKEMQQEFGSLCSRLSRFKPSPKRQW